mgnify:CR=1 FL=1
MTRLTENDIAGIEAEWATYERRLEELTGDDLLTLAARTLGIDPETARSGVRELRVGAIPISSGEGLIGGFADSLASIAGHLGFEADVLPADVPGFQLAKSGGFDLFIWADDDTYLAENILTGTVGENGRATGRGFATALIRMTKEAMAAHPESALHGIAAQSGGVNGCTAFDAAAQGDAAGKAVVEQYIHYLAVGVANMINIFFPEVIGLSGGVANQGENLLAPLCAAVGPMVFGNAYAQKHTRITTCTLGYRAGIGVDAAGQVHRQQQCTVLVLPIH